MSSPYVVLEDRPLDQWKVTELKEELRKRKLMTKGLKDELVKRLDEAVRSELNEANQTHGNGVGYIVPPDDATVEPIVSEEITSITDDTGAKSENIEKDSMIEKLDINESLETDKMTEKMDINESLEKDKMTEKLDINESLDKDSMAENVDDENSDRVHGMQVVEKVSVETFVTISEDIQDLQQVDINKVKEYAEDGESKAELMPPFDIGSRVVDVSQVKSSSISIDTMSVTEKIELKDNVITADGDVKLELDCKPEMSFSKVVSNEGNTESVVLDEMVTTEEKDVSIAESDVGSPAKLDLDQSSGDDSMEEDASESKQIDPIAEITEVPLVKEGEPVDDMVEDTPAAKTIEVTKGESDPAARPIKRKLQDQEAVTNSEVVKRQCRENYQQLTTNSSISTTPKDAFQSSVRQRFSKSNSSVGQEEPKERVVPPSLKAPTTSLRIDRFLRPFTLKAVQNLLGKTGTVVSFWMDQIKTHCYVTYSTVEEAVETRNAVYNLQWPTNGGHLLIAEFVDPSEVKSRIEAPQPSTLPPPLTATKKPPQQTRLPPPSTLPPPLAATKKPPQQTRLPPPSTLPPPLAATKKPPQQTRLPPPPPLGATKPPQQTQLPPPPPLPLPPPPPLYHPPQLVEPAVALPPPPPLPAKMEPPVVTLDDLFRKTRATPRIYYLPLSDEQVAAKVKMNAKQ